MLEWCYQMMTMNCAKAIKTNEKAHENFYDNGQNKLMLSVCGIMLIDVPNIVKASKSRRIFSPFLYSFFLSRNFS
jgi:hypothetical protein